MRPRLLPIVLALFLASCGGSAPDEATIPAGLPSGTLVIERGGERVLELRVSIADTSDSRARGLMNVEELPRDQGMVFLFEQPGRGSFWMKDTLIPLDIAFWNDDGIVVDILQMQPCVEDPCDFYTPKADYIGAVEANENVLDGKVRPGDSVTLSRLRSGG